MSSKQLSSCSAVGMSIVAGTLWGLMLNPITYVQNYVAGASENGLDYVFSFSVGAYVSGTVCDRIV